MQVINICNVYDKFKYVNVKENDYIIFNKYNHLITLEYKYKYFLSMLEENIQTKNIVILPEITAKINILITPEFMLK